MSRSPSNRCLLAVAIRCVFLAVAFSGTPAIAQHHDLHTPGVSGMPQGVPFFCASPTVTSVATGEWSNPATWSSSKVPGAGDKVAIDAGHTVTYDVESSVKIGCIEVRGTLTFRTGANTRLRVVTIMVLENGTLEI